MKIITGLGVWFLTTTTTVVISQPVTAFYGGDGDGFVMQVLIDTGGIFFGGESDGFTMTELNDDNSIYKGNFGDGHAYTTLHDDNSIYRGAISDGFAVKHFLYYHLWTGNSSMQWLSQNNWTGQTIPNVNMRVRIPANRPNYPVLPAGIFKVGDSTQPVDFVCRALQIGPGGQLTIGMNATMRNFSTVEVGGVLRVQNVSVPSLINRPGAELRVLTSGIVRVE